MEEIAKAGHHCPTGVGWVVIEGVDAIPLDDNEGTAVRRECMSQIARVVTEFNVQRTAERARENRFLGTAHIGIRLGTLPCQENGVNVYDCTRLQVSERKIKTCD